jgi:hypothetical protein
MVTLNGLYQVYERSTGQRILSVSAVAFWTAAGITFVDASNAPFDPRVVYDNRTDRYAGQSAYSSQCIEKQRRQPTVVLACIFRFYTTALDHRTVNSVIQHDNRYLIAVSEPGMPPVAANFKAGSFRAGAQVW